MAAQMGEGEGFRDRGKTDRELCQLRAARNSSQEGGRIVQVAVQGAGHQVRHGAAAQDAVHKTAEMHRGIAAVKRLQEGHVREEDGCANGGSDSQLLAHAGVQEGVRIERAANGLHPAAGAAAAAGLRVGALAVQVQAQNVPLDIGGEGRKSACMLQSVRSAVLPSMSLPRPRAWGRKYMLPSNSISKSD